MGNYKKLAAMITTSTILMLILMYLNTYEFSHVYFSETRFYMAIMMGAAMAIVMLSFMLPHYTNRKMNIAIFSGSALLFIISLWLVRSQSTVEDVSWMKAMIPHHSIAILTSKRAKISDPRVKELASGIIATQLKEIEQMKRLIKDLENQ